ncbi:arabinosyltransferase domain-containing protein [Geodermatophilus sp. URMC 64]
MPSDTPALRRITRPRVAVLALAALSLVSALAFVLAPVERPDAVYSWPSAPGDPAAAAIPLMTSTPATLTASVGCAAVRAAGPDGVLLSTLPLRDIPGEEVLNGLRVTATPEDGVRFRTGGVDLSEQALPASRDCTWTLETTATTTRLSLDGRVVEERPEDLRPVVAGVFTESANADDLSVDVTADTLYQTTPSPLKTALAVLAVVSLAAVLVLVARAERARGRADAGAEREPGTARRGRGVRWAVDAVVVGALAVWNVIGPLTVDDGYIAGIIRSADANGYVGNVYRWFNAPEAPFGWFYEVMDGWAHVSTATVWMRIPSTLLGVATWFLIARGLLPRLGGFARAAGSYAAAAVAFGVWWLPSNLGLRPEAWVAAGFAAVLLLVEDALARRRVLPLLVGLVVAGATLGVTPTGAVAFLPFAAAAVPILRLIRRPEGPGLPALAVAAAAAAASALLLMFADQSLAAILQANRIRNELPGAVPWSAEAERWYLLLKAGELQGSLVRRVPVLLTLAAVVGILWRRLSARWPDSAARDVADRLVITAGLSLVVLLFTPTKWTMHFGALVPVGTALIVLGLHLFDRRVTWAGAERGRTPVRSRIGVGPLAVGAAGLTVVLFVAAWSYAGWNQYAYLSNAGVPWNNIPPVVLGKSFSTLFLAAGLLVAAAGAALVVWSRSRDGDGVALPLARWIPSPALVAVGLMAATVLLQFGGLAKAGWERRETYSLAGDAMDTVHGSGCGLAEALRVERSPRAGLLEPSRAASPDRETALVDGFEEITDHTTLEGPALDIGGDRLPGWSATGHTSADGTGPARLVTGWYDLPADFAGGDLPLVVATAGERGRGTNLVAEFGVVSGDTITPVGARGLPPSGDEPAATDARLAPADVPADAQVVRLTAMDGAADTDLPLAVSAPRVPVTEPFSEVVDPDRPAIVDWPVAFVFPCQTLSVQRDGLTDVPEWRIASASDAGDIIVAEFVGGPYAPARTLVDEVRVPVYLEDRPLERPMALYAWEPRVTTTAPRQDVRPTTVPGWAAAG